MSGLLPLLTIPLVSRIMAGTANYSKNGKYFNAEINYLYDHGNIAEAGTKLTILKNPESECLFCSNYVNKNSRVWKCIIYEEKNRNTQIIL